MAQSSPGTVPAGTAKPAARIGRSNTEVLGANMALSGGFIASRLSDIGPSLNQSTLCNIVVVNGRTAK